MTTTRNGIRERTRRAVQREIGDAAIRLFVAQGYEATTVDEIAAAVGMSSRSVFRYFATKEEIVVGKLALGAEEMLDGLRARPIDEPLWASLRRLFDVAAPADQQREMKPVHRVIFETPALLAVYLQMLHGLQASVVAVLGERSAAAGDPQPLDEAALTAVTAAAFGCLVAAQQAWLAARDDEPLGGAIDRAMAAVGPVAASA